MASPKSFPNWENVTQEYLEGKRVVTDSGAYRQLIDLLVFHEWHYYVGNRALINDERYDRLFQLLKNHELAHPESILPFSPTQRVGSDLAEDMPAVEHLRPMLSLENSYDAGDLRDWDQQLKRLLQLPLDENLEYAVEPKFDGGSIALIYADDMLVRAATRGNGVLGEDITANARAIRTIPLRAPFSTLGIRRAELRGEVLIRKDVFDQLNVQRGNKGQAPRFANARNTAAGGLRMKDPREVAQRGLEAFIYTLGYAEDEAGGNILSTFASHHESMNRLAELGFRIPEGDHARCTGIESVIQRCDQWQEDRDAYPYEIDGVVIKLDSRELQERSGATAHHPRWAMAFKFKARQARSKLLDVEFQVGKTGSITPVAKIEKTLLAGVHIQSISLHNEEFIRSRDLRIGDTILIERAGDVIPYIAGNFPELRDGKETEVLFPVHCPVNDTEEPVRLAREEGEAIWRCPQCVCGKQVLQRLIFHVSKEAMDIDGMGSVIVERFYDLGFVRSIADIYRLDYAKIAQLEGFKQQSADNLRNSVEKAKQNPLHRLLISLGIHHLGKKASRLLAAEVGSIFELAAWPRERYLLLKDIGPVVAENALAFFGRKANMDLLRELADLGVNTDATAADRPREAAGESPLAGKTILFTGTLQRMGRKEAQEKAEQAGARNLSAVSSQLDYLVTGENAGSKRRKAEEIPSIQIISEAEFLSLLGE